MGSLYVSDELLVRALTSRARDSIVGPGRKPALQQVRSELALLVNEGSKAPSDLWGDGLTPYLRKLGMSPALVSKYRVAGRLYETAYPDHYLRFFLALSKGGTVDLPVVGQMLRYGDAVIPRKIEALVLGALNEAVSPREVEVVLHCLHGLLLPVTERLIELRRQHSRASELDDDDEEYGRSEYTACRHT